MAETSLSASIFGKSEKNEGSLSNLFNTSSSTLPATPNNVNFTETSAERNKRERKEEKRKKRKAKLDKDKVDATSTPKVQEETKEKKRKILKGANEGESNDTEVQTDGVEANGDSAGVSSDDETRTIFVGNLPLEITRKQLGSVFRECGKIKSSRLRSFGTSGVKVAPEHAGNQVRL